jgi:hypothetical protein
MRKLLSGTRAQWVGTAVPDSAWLRTGLRRVFLNEAHIFRHFLRLRFDIELALLVKHVATEGAGTRRDIEGLWMCEIDGSISGFAMSTTPMPFRYSRSCMGTICFKER